MKGIRKLIEGNLVEILLIMVPFIIFGYVMISMSAFNLWCSNGILNILGYCLGILVGIGLVYGFTSISLRMFIEE